LHRDPDSLGKSRRLFWQANFCAGLGKKYRDGIRAPAQGQRIAQTAPAMLMRFDYTRADFIGMLLLPSRKLPGRLPIRRIPPAVMNFSWSLVCFRFAAAVGTY
jgi:hypothetical protein